jgi:hypothetical protein
MDRYKALSRGTQLMLAAGVLLLVDTFLSWQRFEALGIELASQNAWNGFWGVLLGLLTIALLAWLVATMLGVDLRLPVSETLLSAALGGLVLVVALLKVLTDDFSTVWAWIGLVLAALVGVGAWLRVQEGGGMDTLRTEAATLRGTPETPETPQTPEAPGPPGPPSQEPPA